MAEKTKAELAAELEAALARIAELEGALDDDEKTHADLQAALERIVELEGNLTELQETAQARIEELEKAYAELEEILDAVEAEPEVKEKPSGMICYDVVGAGVKLPGGNVRLTIEQAKTRAHALEAVGEPDNEGVGTFLIKQPIQFKQGEKFWYDGVPTRAMAHQLEELGRLDR